LSICRDALVAESDGPHEVGKICDTVRLGNYGEIFERAAGRPYHLERGLNRLWTDGGLMRPVPIR
jgi:hypothetical protein